MHDALKHTARQWLAQGRAARVVQVLRSRGSVPREVGARMLVAADATAGSIGGGHLEWQAMAVARAALAAGGAAALAVDQQDITLGASLGQCCGGVLTLHSAPLDTAALASWPEPPALFDLQLFGAGHVGQAIVRLLATLPCTVRWIDERESQFAMVDMNIGAAVGAGIELPPHMQTLCVEPGEIEVQQAAPNACYLVMTHSHALDLKLTEAILRRGDFAYLGLIGSATKRARFERRMTQRGIAACTLARLTCPIGLPGIDGKQPEVIAMAVVAQILQSMSTAAAGFSAQATARTDARTDARPAAHTSANTTAHPPHCATLKP